MKKLTIILLLTIQAQADILVTPSPSPVPVATVAASQILSNIKDMLGNAPRRMAASQAILWHNSGATPCQVFSALGTDAAQVIKAGTGLITYLNYVSPGIAAAVPHPGYTVTPQGNGSVTCTGP